MGFERFSLGLVLRVSIAVIVIVIFAILVAIPGYLAASVLSFFVIVGIVYEIFQYISRSNRELTRFLDAARYGDFGQRFQFENLGAGFDALGESFTQILNRIRENRNEQESEIRHLSALLEHVPVPLISIMADERIKLWNNSARQMFGTVQVEKLSDFEQFGAEFFDHIKSIKPGQQRVATFRSLDVEQQLKISASEITIASETERLISLQNIQNELDGMQLNAWQDLVRVLTHEIMNSMTPVTSLAKTTANLIDDASSKLESNGNVIDSLIDARDAANTVARRSDGLLDFVSSYRQLTRLPEPKKTQIKLDTLFSDVADVATEGWNDKGIGFRKSISPDQLHINADQQMIEQVLINLIRNSEQALDNTSNPKVTLSGKLNARGNVSIEIADNGPGIPTGVAGKIFVPFYTTRNEGSGVGLALSRQIMIAHGGSISFSNIKEGGARFTLVF